MTASVFVLLVLFITRCASKMQSFIAGGSYAKIENFPHSVYLYMTCDTPQVCGGSILTQHMVLSAAHCFEDCSKKHEMIAYAGSEKTDTFTVANNIKAILMHNKYNTKSLENDIALGATQTPLKLSKTIKRVMMARNFPGVTMAQIAGWGAVNDQTQEQTQRLKMVMQILQPVTTCSEVFPIKKGMMCAKNSQKNHPSHGDSGSALVSRNGQQIGLVSFRSPERMEVVIYTNVSYFYDWIQTQASRLYCQSTV